MLLDASPAWLIPVPYAEEVLRKVTHSFGVHIVNGNPVLKTGLHGGNTAVSKTKYFLDFYIPGEVAGGGGRYI